MYRHDPRVGGQSEIRVRSVHVTVRLLLWQNTAMHHKSSRPNPNFSVDVVRVSVPISAEDDCLASLHFALEELQGSMACLRRELRAEVPGHRDGLYPRTA